MRLLLSIFVSIIAILITAFYHQQENSNLFPEFMQRLGALKNLSKNLKLDSKNQSSAMSTNKSFVGYPVIPTHDSSLDATNPKPRSIQNVFLAREQGEGMGARVRRSIGTPKLRHLSPFLMLDHFNVSPGAGFPDHPHRGQETITYLLEGAADHEDFAGNKGTIWAGDLQFMTAGRGIVHAEMPHDNGDGSANIGMQLWVDLPKELKMTEPRYRDLRANEIPTVEADDGKVTVKVISGRSHGVDSVQELAYTPVWLLDVTIRPGGKIAQSLPAEWNAFAYILDGTVTFDTGATTQQVEKYHNTVFERKGDQILASVPEGAEEEARMILVAGLPLDQPIVQHGPFVLTDPSQVREAIMDYSTFTNGFERAENWRSEIGKSMMI